MKSRIGRIFFSLFATLISLPAFADGGTNVDYSPYSKFGIGVLANPGTAYTRSMGGVGVATRDNRYLNVMNPAAVTARDTLAFMADFSLAQNNSYYQQGDVKSVNNTFNIRSLSMSFPIWKSSAFMIGFAPFSSVAYEVTSKETDPAVIGHTGNITDAFVGTGSMYQLYVGAGATFWKRLSVGAQFTYYFGNLEKSSTRNFSSSNYRSIYYGTQMTLHGFNGKLGLQYEQPIGNKNKLIAGLTYRMPTKLRGPDKDARNPHGKIEIMQTAIQSDIVDTLLSSYVSLGNVNIAQEFGFGLSYHHGDKWSAEVNYTFADWQNSQMDKVTGFKLDGFTANRSQSINAGFEIVPNRSDIRYYIRRCSYRVGGYYNVEYYKYNGNAITSYGVTLGMSLPVFRWYNALTVGVDFGQRGSLKNNMMRERYIGFNVSLNVFDIWFRKPMYE